MTRAFLALAAMVCCSAIAEQVSAMEPEHRQWEFTGFGGASFLGHYLSSTPVSGASGQESGQIRLKYSSGYQVGFRLTENVYDHWAVSLEYSFSNQHLTFSNLTNSTPSFDAGSMIHRFAYDVAYCLRDPSKRLRPYVFVGPGASIFHISQSSQSMVSDLGIRFTNPWKFTANLGSGVNYLLHDHLSGNFQFRDSISGVPAYGLPATGISGFSPRGLMNNILISAGLVYEWDSSH